MLFLTGCVGLNSKPSFSQHMTDLGFATQVWQTPHYQLQGWVKHTDPNITTAHVYIEGDGFAYIRKSIPSTDPTLNSPAFGLLAAQDNAGLVIYLARPCQWVRWSDPACTVAAWTNKRFDEDTLTSFNTVFTELKNTYPIEAFTVIGYSGGGVIANLLAIERQDVQQFITIAAPLDLNEWTLYHQVSTLATAYNPYQYQQKLQHIPQMHYVGENDRIVPPFLMQHYVNKIALSKANVAIVPHATHQTILKKIQLDKILEMH